MKYVAVVVLRIWYRKSKEWMYRRSCNRNQNVRVTARNNKGYTQHSDKGHTPRIEIKIHGPTGNRTCAAGLEGREFTDHATATGQK